jgi:uncharacterized protein
MIMRAVLDTNAVLSALLFASGRLAWMRAAWQSGRLLTLVSRETGAELLRVLAYPKFRLGADEQEELLADYLPFCEAVLVPPRMAGTASCRDIHDRPFLRLAVAGRADALVSGDADLLAMKPHFHIPILTPAELRERLPPEPA